MVYELYGIRSLLEKYSNYVDMDIYIVRGGMECWVEQVDHWHGHVFGFALAVD